MVVLFNTPSEAMSAEMEILSSCFGDTVQSGNHLEGAKVIIYTSPKDLTAQAGQHPDACHIVYMSEEKLKKSKVSEEMLVRNGMDILIDDSDIAGLANAVSKGFVGYPYSQQRDQHQQQSATQTSSVIQVGDDREKPTATIKEEYAITSDNKIQLRGLENKFIVGTSPATLQLLKSIRQYVKFEEDALILGENGTGKELVTRTLALNSPRHKDNKKNFFSVDIGAESDNLFMSNLVGSVRGAFTGAEDSKGYLREYSGGTLFFDEVGNISYAKQQMLLRLLMKDPETDKRTAVPLGSSKAYNFDVRFIMATNADLQKALKDGTLREDFFNRINTMVIQVPPLRERREDIPLLAGSFIDKMSKRYPDERKDIEPEALKILQSLPWPGNVRELEKTIQRAFMIEESRTIKEETIIKATMANNYKPLQSVQQNHEYLVEHGLAQKQLVGVPKGIEVIRTLSDDEEVAVPLARSITEG